jgi:peptide/nickel transport system substrate-binding protein
MSERRWSRRRFLAAGSGLAVSLAAGCDGDGASPSPRASPQRAAGAVVPAPEQSRGGALRLPGFEAFVADTLDPHQTQFGPIYSSHSAVFSKVLRYEDAAAGLITTDLASSMPESVDGQEFIISLRRNVRFQRPSEVLRRPASPQELAVAGRELTAEDVVYSFQRQVDRSSPRYPLYYRSYQYDTFERVEAVDRYTVRIVTGEPLALFYHYLADTNAFIIARETVDDTDSMNSQEAMIGSGPFIWDRLEALRESRFVRNPDWFGWDDPDLRRPYLDGYHSLFIVSDASLESVFRRKQLDAAIQVSNPGWVRKVREDFPEVQARDVSFIAWLNSRFLADRPPFNDLRVRKAIHLVVDRDEVVDVLFQGSGRIHGPLSPVLERWALPEDELRSLPGYRRDRERREADRREARLMFEQAGSPEIQITFADQPAYVAAYASQFQRGLEEALGANVKILIRNYVQIAESLLRGDIPMSWQFDNGWIDPDEWFYPYFHSRGPKNSFRLSDPRLDRMLDAQRREFDFEVRRALVLDIQRYLLENVLVRLDYASPINLWVAWPYYRNFKPSPFWGESFHLANAWIDKDHPSYEGRPV